MLKLITSDFLAMAYCSAVFIVSIEDCPLLFATRNTKRLTFAGVASTIMPLTCVPCPKTSVTFLFPLKKL